MTKGDQETLSGDSIMHENLMAARTPTQTPLGELTALPQIPWLVRTGEGAGCPLLKNSVPTFDHSVKHVDESLPALLEKSSHVVWKVATLNVTHSDCSS